MTKVFLPPSWQSYMLTVDYPKLRTATYENMQTERIVPTSLWTADRWVCNSFGVVENLAVELLLGTTFIDRWIRGIFPLDLKIVPWQSHPVDILSTQPRKASIFSDITFIDKDPLQVGEEEEYFSSRVNASNNNTSWHVSQSFSSTRGSGIVIIETHRHLAEGRCSVVAWGIVDTF